MRALVTGGAGFIGSHLVDRLVSEGAEVVVLDDFSYGREINLSLSHGRFELVRSSLLDADALAFAARGADAVFHLAAFSSVQRSLDDPDGTYAVNVVGSQRVFEAAFKNGARVVFSSSSAVYGNLEFLPARESSPAAPISPYGSHKLSCEESLRQHRLRGVSLRYFNVYGPRQNPLAGYAAAVPAFLERALRGEPIVIFGDGLSTRDYVHVEDVVEANFLALDKATVEGKVYNIGCGHSITVNELAEAVLHATGSSVAIEHMAGRKGEIRRSECDASLALRELGFSPKVSLTEGLGRFRTAAA